MLLGRRPVSLTSRLVLTVVLLVIGVTFATGAVTSFAVNRYLTERLDDEVLAALGRARLFRDDFVDGDRDDFPAPGQAVGTLTAFLPSPGDTEPTRGDVLVQRGTPPAEREPLSGADLDAIRELPTDGQPRDVSLPDAGHFRVAVIETPDGEFATGLPTSEVEAVFDTLVTWEIGLLLLSGLGSVVAGTVLVRRQMRPLNEVAATAHVVAGLPLATDQVDLRDRVPAHLRDERTEVGQVGDALAGLLTHVGTSLEARRRSEEQVRRFVADASHELRTPLTTIAGYVELARRRPDDTDATRTALAKVEEEAGRMTGLVEDLLLLARLDAGRPLARESVDVTRLLLEAVTDARVVAPDHRWHVDVPDGAVEVTGDEQRLHEVVTNLLTNARKYTPAGSTVTARAHVVDGRAVVEVHDDGPGFDDDAASHAFERFTRGDPARQRAGGAGLGLALVKAIAEAHGGTVSLRSAPGDTTVSVGLPAQPADRGAPTTVDA